MALVKRDFEVYDCWDFLGTVDGEQSDRSSRVLQSMVRVLVGRVEREPDALLPGLLPVRDFTFGFGY